MDDAAYSLFVPILFCTMLKKIYSGLERSQHVQNENITRKYRKRGTHKNTKEEATAGVGRCSHT